MQGKLRVLTRENGKVDIPVSADGGERGIMVLGCMLWSQIPRDKSAALLGEVKDSVEIEDWSLETHNTEHAADLQWLRREIERFKGANVLGEKLLVVTHHAPAMEECSHAKHAANPWNSAFGTELLMDAASDSFGKVSCWVFGHTHYTTEFRMGAVRVVSNQRGYVIPERGEKGVLNSVVGKLKKKGRLGEHDFDVCKVIHV